MVISDNASAYDAARDRLFSLLKEKGLSQKDFAEMLQISPQTVTDWKKGKSRSFTLQIGQICNLLETTPTWILFGAGRKYISTADKQLAEMRATTAQKESAQLIHSDLVGELAKFAPFSALRDDTFQMAVANAGIPMQDVFDQIKANYKKATRIPVLGEVAAGIPIEAIQDIVDHEEIDAALAATGEFFGLRIKGSSMEPRIREGDVVIVRRQEDAETGDTAVVLVNGDSATVKRIKKEPDGGIWLIPNNPAYDSRHFSPAEIRDLPVNIIGKVVELRGKF